MEKRNRIEAINGERQLPEPIIQHIQSFLNGKEAAQTSILSKSWYSAWLTRPNLDFDQCDFERLAIDQNTKEFWKSIKKTMQRYEELKLKIESFTLSAFQSLLANQLIVKAMKMGATRLALDLRTGGTTKFVLPHEVLESKTLIRLSVKRCRIDQRDHGKTRSLELSPINQHEFHKLKYLVLEYVDIDNLFFGDFSSRFPCLKELSVNCCYGYNEIKISSCSLECISLARYQDEIWRVNFDVPSIRKFDFRGSELPSLSFKTASREWASDISIECYQACTSWFLKFKKFLKELSPSKISLTLDIWNIRKDGSDYAGDIKVLPRTTVENLMLLPPSSVNSAFLEGLFWSCRPKFIAHYWLPGGTANNDFLENLCKRLVQGVSENCSIPYQNMSGLHDLKEVNVELFEESLAEWRTLPWKTLLDAAASPTNNRKIRFKLSWGQEPIHYIQMI